MKVVLTGGKFNKIHEGHLWLLKMARSFGDRLVVVLAHDSHNIRPYALPAKERKKNLERMGLADEVIIGDKSDFFKVIKKAEPSVIVLGYDQELPEAVKEKLDKKIKIVKLKKHGDYSTKDLE